MATTFAAETVRPSLFWTGVTLLALWGCGGGEAREQEEGEAPRMALMEACGTQQGIGWLKREYGENYCACWADTAQEVLSEANYRTLAIARWRRPRVRSSMPRILLIAAGSYARTPTSTPQCRTLRSPARAPARVPAAEG